eukprot:g15140.t1
MKRRFPLCNVGRQVTRTFQRQVTSLPQIPGVIFSNGEIFEDKLIGQVRAWAQSSEALKKEHAFDLLQVAENVGGKSAPRVVCGLWRTRPSLRYSKLCSPCRAACAMGDIEGGSCATMCFEADGVHTKEQLIYKGQGMGSYSQVSSMEMVGKGRGDFEKERVQVASGSKLRLPCIGAAVFAVVLLLAIGIWRLLPPTGASDPCMSRSAARTIPAPK